MEAEAKLDQANDTIMKQNQEISNLSSANTSLQQQRDSTAFDHNKQASELSILREKINIYEREK